MTVLIIEMCGTGAPIGFFRRNKHYMCSIRQGGPKFTLIIISLVCVLSMCSATDAASWVLVFF